MSGIGETMVTEAWQKGIQQGLQQGIQEGIQEGIQKGENLLAALVGYLTRDKRFQDLEHLSDAGLRKELYEEYNLTGENKS